MKIYKSATALLVLSFVAIALQAHGESVVCRPGEISELISADYQSITELKVSGRADARDFFFIAENLPALQTLDLSQCTIAAYSGDAIAGLTSHPANTIPQGVFCGSPITALMLPATGSVAIGDCAFAGSAIRTLTVPASITSIGQGAFSNCANLTDVTLYDAKSGGYIFNNCPQLASVNLGCTSAIGNSDFAMCPKLRTISNTERLTTIGDSSFKGCTSLESFFFYWGLTSIGESAFAYTSLKEADMGTTRLQTIGPWAFAYNSKLTTVTFHPLTATIGEGALFNCPALAEIVLPKELEALADYVLKGASALAAFDIPYHTASIGQYAMKGMDSTERLTLPWTLESIGDNAMEGMSSLTAIDASALSAVPELGKEVWKGVDQASVRLDVNQDIADAYESAEQWQDFDIHPVHSGIDAPLATNAPAVRGRFDGGGNTLLIEATGAGLATVELFDVAGVLLTRLNVGGSDSVAIDTSATGTMIFLVRCTLADGSVATLKIARK